MPRISTPLLAGTLLFITGTAALAQGDPRLCKSFCAMDAAACRKDVQDQTSEWNPLEVTVANRESFKDDFTTEKQRSDFEAETRTLALRGQTCNSERRRCENECGTGTPEVTPGAASAPTQAASPAGR